MLKVLRLKLILRVARLLRVPIAIHQEYLPRVHKAL